MNFISLNNSHYTFSVACHSNFSRKSRMNFPDSPKCSTPTQTPAADVMTPPVFGSTPRRVAMDTEANDKNPNQQPKDGGTEADMSMSRSDR